MITQSILGEKYKKFDYLNISLKLFLVHLNYFYVHLNY